MGVPLLNTLVFDTPLPGNIDFEWFNIERFRMERKSSQLKDRSLPQERPILWQVGYSKGRRNLIKTGVIYLEWTGSVDVLIDVNNDIMGRKKLNMFFLCRSLSIRNELWVNSRQVLSRERIMTSGTETSFFFYRPFPTSSLAFNFRFLVQYRFITNVHTFNCKDKNRKLRDNICGRLKWECP